MGSRRFHDWRMGHRLNTRHPLECRFNSTPIADVEAGKEHCAHQHWLRAKHGNHELQSVLALMDNADIVDRIKYTSQESVTEDLLARLFNVDRVLIMAGTYNTAAEGATASYSQVGDRDALALLHAYESRPHGPVRGIHNGLERV
jgi:hypothetical protein